MGNVSATRANLVSTRYRYEQTTTSSILTRRPMATELVREGLFRDSSDASARAVNDVALFGEDRERFVLKLYNYQFTVKVGETITLTHPRFMPSGKDFIVVKVVEVDQGSQRYTQLTVWG